MQVWDEYWKHFQIKVLTKFLKRERERENRTNKLHPNNLSLFAVIWRLCKIYFLKYNSFNEVEKNNDQREKYYEIHQHPTFHPTKLAQFVPNGNDMIMLYATVKPSEFFIT